MSENKTILMVAAENDALPKAKVGGIADVVRDIPQALAQQGCVVKVVVPDYGHFAGDINSECIDYFSVSFRGRIERVALYRVRPKATIAENENVSYWALSHPDFIPCGQGQVYCHDGADRPFATDANKYAFFCAAVAQNIIQGGFGGLDVLHLHDWHAAFVAILRAFDARYSALRSISTVYSIHNLSLQGVRPFKGDNSSLHQWFPQLNYDNSLICDPKYPQCVNPMRAGINLSDRVHAVSPHYANEIQQASHYALGIYGGEGLEADILRAKKEGRLFGILNGCDYPAKPKVKKHNKAQLIEIMNEVLTNWICRSDDVSSYHWLAKERLNYWAKQKERGFLTTSIGRITDQKARLLRETVEFKGRKATALEHILKTVANKGCVILLGSGQAEFERFFLEVCGRNKNFIYLQGYSELAGDVLYASGDLFLMPSSFEPCGISQMLAMRSGQPCLVHHVGGLVDTVKDSETGFAFGGKNIQEQASALVERFVEVFLLAKNDANRFKAVAKNAKAERFLWSNSAKEYVDKLYS